MEKPKEKGGYFREVVDQMLTKRGQWRTIGPAFPQPFGPPRTTYFFGPGRQTRGGTPTPPLVNDPSGEFFQIYIEGREQQAPFKGPNLKILKNKNDYVLSSAKVMVVALRQA